MLVVAGSAGPICVADAVAEGMRLLVALEILPLTVAFTVAVWAFASEPRPMRTAPVREVSGGSFMEVQSGKPGIRLSAYDNALQ